MRSVLITGGTGSFGQEFVRHLLAANLAERIVVFSRDWVKQSQMETALHDERVRFFLGDVCDYSRMEEVLRGVDTVVHAAAFKHVTLCEKNPDEAVRVNVIGTRTVLKAAISAGVESVLALSSDKAVQPLNAYGKSKALMENLVIKANDFASHTKTRCSVIRYGNVLGTRGSVVEVWRRQALEARAISVNSSSTRFLLSVSTAATLVEHCLSSMRGGEIFVPLLPSVRIQDLADVLFPSSYKIEYALAPGEKSHEMLVTPEEQRSIHCIGGSSDSHFDLPYVSSRNPLSKKGIQEWLDVNSI